MFPIWLIFFLFCVFFFFSVFCLNCVFLHLIRGNYLFLCLGFESALTLIYMSMKVWRINCLVFFFVELQKIKKIIQQKNICGSKSKGNKYILKKKDKKKGSSTQLFVTILFVVYWCLLAIGLCLRVSVLSPLNLFSSPIIF